MTAARLADVASEWHGPGSFSPGRARAVWIALFTGLPVVETNVVQLGNSRKYARLSANCAGVRLSVHGEFRVNPGDQHLSRRQELPCLERHRLRDRDRKVSWWPEHQRGLVGHLFRHVPRNAILLVGMFFDSSPSMDYETAMERVFFRHAMSAERVTRTGRGLQAAIRRFRSRTSQKHLPSPVVVLPCALSLIADFRHVRYLPTLRLTPHRRGVSRSVAEEKIIYAHSAFL